MQATDQVHNVMVVDVRVQARTPLAGVDVLHVTLLPALDMLLALLCGVTSILQK